MGNLSFILPQPWKFEELSIIAPMISHFLYNWNVSAYMKMMSPLGDAIDARLYKQLIRKKG